MIEIMTYDVCLTFAEFSSAKLMCEGHILFWPWPSCWISWPPNCAQTAQTSYAGLRTINKHRTAYSPTSPNISGHRCQTFEGGFGGEPGIEVVAPFRHTLVHVCTPQCRRLAGTRGLYVLRSGCHGADGQIGPYRSTHAPGLLLWDWSLVPRDDQWTIHNRCIEFLVPQRWLVGRQMRLEGGFQGRQNKLVDGCYSFWQVHCSVFPQASYCLAFYFLQRDARVPLRQYCSSVSRWNIASDTCLASRILRKQVMQNTMQEGRGHVPQPNVEMSS